ncbi:MAG: glycosyltransferase [Leptolyngbya sp. PLA1]|nr:glycosyltransferase [Leptolyngbya sp. PLA1]
MRVLHVIESLDPRTGGPPAVAARLGAAQAALGARVGIAALSEPGAAERVRASFASIPGLDSISLHELPRPSGPIERLRLTRLAAALTDLARGVQVMHVHGVWDVTVRASYAASVATRVPMVVVPHGMLDPWSMRATPAKRVKKSMAMALTFRRILNHACFFHTLNADEQTGMAPLGLRPPCEVIPNGVFLDEFANLPGPEEFRATHAALGTEPFVLFLSRLHHKKGLDILADAFSLVLRTHPGARLVVAGPDGGALGPLTSQVRRLGMADRVHLVGPLYGRDKLAALVGCAAFCLPSRQEGFSMAITEAMACARPVVVSDACHFPEVASAGAGHVVSLDPAAVAHSLCAVLGDPGGAREMGLRGRELVESKFTWPVIARRCMEAYARHGVSGA